MNRIIIIVVSILLPLLSHIIRQAVSCSNIMKPYEYTTFMIVYSVSMFMHGLWIDTKSVILIKILLLLFNITFIVSIVVHTFATHMFLVAWSFHAVPASFMWPFAYKLVNEKKRSKTLLVLWSLQGNIGDYLGCFYSIFDVPILYNPMTIVITTVNIITLFMVPIRTTDISEHNENAESLFDPLFETNRNRRNASFHLLITIFASCCIKTMTYSSSNFLPQLHLKYSSYAIGGIFGTLCSGILADIKISRISLHISSIFLLVFCIFSIHSNYVWSNHYFSALFGCFSAFSSSMLSICICTDIADRTEKHGRTTAIIDSVSTIFAACIQLFMCRPQNFVVVQTISSVLLCIMTMILCILNRIAYCRMQ